MGLIRKAAEQRRQAIEVIRKRSRGWRDFDVVIAGCEPAGLSYRGAAFSRVKQANRLALDQAERAGRVHVELESTVHSIEADAVKLQTRNSLATVRNAAVIVCVGGQLPTTLLQSVGITFDTQYGKA